MPHYSRPELVSGGLQSISPLVGAGMFTTRGVVKQRTATPGLEPLLVIKDIGCYMHMTTSSACVVFGIRGGSGAGPWLRPEPLKHRGLLLPTAAAVIVTGRCQ